MLVDVGDLHEKLTKIAKSKHLHVEVILIMVIEEDLVLVQHLPSHVVPQLDVLPVLGRVMLYLGNWDTTPCFGV